MRNTITFLSLFLLGGCVNVQTSYVEPNNSPKASLKVIYKNLSHHKNIHINYHEETMCDPQSTKFVGLLNAVVAGQPNKSEIVVSIPANKLIGISAPQFSLEKFGGLNTGAPSTLSVCEPLVTFTPKENQSYVVEISPCKAIAYASSTLVASSETENSCKVHYENLGNPSKYEEFHLNKN
jgi:hypothetical protein